MNQQQFERLEERDRLLAPIVSKLESFYGKSNVVADKGAIWVSDTEQDSIHHNSISEIAFEGVQTLADIAGFGLTTSSEVLYPSGTGFTKTSIASSFEHGVDGLGDIVIELHFPRTIEYL